MPSSIPDGALLTLAQHFADVLQSARSCSKIEVTGQTGGQEDKFVCSGNPDGSFDVQSKWYGRALDVHAQKDGDGLQFKSVGGDVAVDLKAQWSGSNYDLTGSLDQRPIEYHRVVHAGVTESGSIGDTPFHLIRWAAKDGAVLKGSLGKSEVLEQFIRDARPHPEVSYTQFWKGSCGDVAIDDTVTYTVGTR